MIKIIKNEFNNLDNTVKKIMKNGFKFAFTFCIFSTIILLIYTLFYKMPIIYYAGTTLFKTSLMFFADFIILGIGFDKIKKQMA